jgi:hypothetical protein
MGRKARTIPAHPHGLESKKKSGRRRNIFLDFPFYRTYQDLARSASLDRMDLEDKPLI